MWLAVVPTFFGVLGIGLWMREVAAFRRQQRLSRRTGLAPLRSVDDGLDELSGSLWSRVFQPWVARWTDALAARLVPARTREELARRLKIAGVKMSLNTFVLVRFLVTVALLGIGEVAGILDYRLPGRVRLVLPFGMALVGYMFFSVRLKTRYQKRVEELERNLPEVFDFLSVSVEAGLAFDGALRRMVQKTTGVVQDEFGRVLNDIQVGLTREEALRGLAERTKSVELKRFASLVAQSDRTGSGIAVALRVQGQRLKEIRVFKAREKAATLPVKMLFPMVLFIFPTLFVVVVGPGVINIVHLLFGAK